MSPSTPLTALRWLEDDLRRVEEGLFEAVAAQDEFIAEMVGHLIAAGGKRVRPGLCIAASLVFDEHCGSASQAVVRGGVSVELIHIGSLYHDDVIDGAMTRRSVRSANAQWGNLRAILAGDYLLGRASEIAASLGTEVAGLVANTLTRLCEGQLLEIEGAFDQGRTEEQYERAIAGKTAALLSTSCRIGALVAELPRPAVEAVADFGHSYGMAFQIVDDILDLVSTESRLGKSSGNDIAEGVYTLPVLRALADGSNGDELRCLLAGPIDDAARDRAVALVRASRGVDEARATARAWAERARDALAGLPETPASNAMRSAAGHLTESTLLDRAR